MTPLAAEALGQIAKLYQAFELEYSPREVLEYGIAHYADAAEPRKRAFVRELKEAFESGTEGEYQSRRPWNAGFSAADLTSPTWPGCSVFTNHGGIPCSLCVSPMPRSSRPP